MIFVSNGVCVYRAEIEEGLREWFSTGQKTLSYGKAVLPVGNCRAASKSLRCWVNSFQQAI
jgi:hypothetical protein